MYLNHTAPQKWEEVDSWIHTALYRIYITRSKSIDDEPITMNPSLQRFIPLEVVVSVLRCHSPIFQNGGADLIYVLKELKAKLFNWNKWALTVVFWVSYKHINRFYSGTTQIHQF